MKIFSAALIVALCIAGSATAQPGGTVISAIELAESAHASDGSERAKGGPPRFVGGLGAAATTYKGWQYAIYYTGKDRSKPAAETYADVIVARRRVGSDDWQRAKIADYRLTSEDAHNRASIGISSGDGRIHVAFDHHAIRQLNYAATAPGIADAPEQTAWNDKTFAYTKDFGWKDFRWRLSYPEFVDDGRGGLLMYFRDGGTVGGEMQKVRYDARARAWDTQITRISTKDGNFNGATDTRGPYLSNGIHVGADGSLQMSWMFREAECFSKVTSRAAGAGIQCSHGLYYAKSRDGGRVWLRSDNTPIADTAKGETVGIDNLGGPVVDLPYALQPSSSTAAIDPKTGNFHVLVSHFATPGQKASRATFHYVGTPAGKWSGGKSSIDGGDNDIAFVGDKAYAFSQRGDARFYVADRAQGFDNWQEIVTPAVTGRGLPRGGRPAGGYSTWDLSAIDRGRVTLFWQLPAASGNPGDPTAIWAIDYRLP